MNLQEILSEWDQDCIIDKTKLKEESLRSERLHSKYLRELVNANMMLEKKKTEYNKIILEKYIFYTEGAKSIKDIHKAPRGAVLKSEAEKYIQADDDIITITLELALIQEKCNTLKAIILAISKRSFNITNAINFDKFMAGES